MKRFALVGAIALALGVATPQWRPALDAGQGAPLQFLTFVPTDANIPNPERGFNRGFNAMFVGSERQPLTVQTLRNLRDDGITTIKAYYVIDEFKDGPISNGALAEIAKDFAAVRDAGVKIIPRFAYVFPCVGSTEPCRVTAAGSPDAPLERVLGHLDQLAPLLRANSDVIAFMEMGFVGPWGEWHTSSNELINANGTANEKSRAIVERVLWALSETRMAALRSFSVKQQLFGAEPLSPDEAFTTSPRARIGFHDDCFLAGPTARSTYVNQDNRFVPQGGETCSSAAEAQPYIQCYSALHELAFERWSTLSLDYQKNVIDLWRQQGCFAEIRNRLGYRFRLVNAYVPSEARPDGPMSVTFTIANDGFAAPFNPRAALLVLRHAQTGRRIVLEMPADPRRWSAGETHTVTVSGTIPADAEPGDYQVLLTFPDPEPTLYSRPEYAIRLANDDLWEPSTGSNVLPARIAISPDARDAPPAPAPSPGPPPGPTTLTIQPATLPTLTVGVPIRMVLIAAGGTGTGWTFRPNEVGSQIPGLAINTPRPGMLGGTPTTAGPYLRGFTVSDSGGNTGTVVYSGTVLPAP